MQMPKKKCQQIKSLQPSFLATNVKSRSNDSEPRQATALTTHSAKRMKQRIYKYITHDEVDIKKMIHEISSSSLPLKLNKTLTLGCATPQIKS